MHKVFLRNILLVSEEDRVRAQVSEGIRFRALVSEERRVKAQVSKALCSAFQETGFAYLVNHGIEPHLIQQVHCSFGSKKMNS